MIEAFRISGSRKELGAYWETTGYMYYIDQHSPPLGAKLNPATYVGSCNADLTAASHLGWRDWIRGGTGAGCAYPFPGQTSFHRNTPTL